MADLPSDQSSGGATSSPPILAKPSGSKDARTAMLASTTSTSMLVTLLANDRLDVRRRLPRRQVAPALRHPHFLVVGRRRRVQVRLFDDMLRPHLARRQLAGADPPADGLGIASDATRR